MDVGVAVAAPGATAQVLNNGPLFEMAGGLQRGSVDPRTGHGHEHRTALAVLSRQGKFRDAIPHLTRAIELNPDNATAHNNLGAAVGREGRLDEAIRHFAEALRLRPGYAEARDNLRKAQALQQRSRPAP